MEIVELAPGMSNRRLVDLDGAFVWVGEAPLVSTADIADARFATAEGVEVFEIDLRVEAASRLVNSRQALSGRNWRSS